MGRGWLLGAASVLGESAPDNGVSTYAVNDQWRDDKRLCGDTESHWDIDCVHVALMMLVMTMISADQSHQ